MTPLRRAKGLLTEHLPDETVLYDTTRHTSYCLNRQARLVWAHCDGRTTVAELARHLGAALGRPADERQVWLILARFEQEGLLERPLAPPAGVVPRSRRAFAKQAALVGLSAPLLLTVVAPTPAQAASICGRPGFDCCHHGSPCGPTMLCCSGNCSGGVCIGG